MTKRRGRPPAGPDRVREPVQVYLDGPDQLRLERLAEQLQSTKSDVLRRGLESLERQLTDPARHPALRIVGLLEGVPEAEFDVAREHDRFLADAEVNSWRAEPSRSDEKGGRNGG